MDKKIVGGVLVTLVTLTVIILYQVEINSKPTSSHMPDLDSTTIVTPNAAPLTVYYKIEDSIYGIMIIQVNATDYATIFTFDLWWNGTDVLHNTDFCVKYNGQTVSIAPLGDRSQEIWIDNDNQTKIMLYAYGKLPIEDDYKLCYIGTDNVNLIAYNP